MSDRSQARETRVQIQRPADPAIHICRYPVPEPREFGPSIVVPFPRQDPSQVGSLAMEELALPESFSGGRHPIIPSDLDIGLTPLWGVRDGSPLLLPPDVLARRQMADEWGAATYVTLADLGQSFDTEAVSQVAWWVLAQAPREQTVKLLADLSWLVDVNGANSMEMERLVSIMAAPPAVGGRLLAEIRTGRPLLHPRAVLWVLREVAAADEDELGSRRAWRPGFEDSSELLAHAFFPHLARGAEPSTRDVLLAVWLLHQAFHGYAPEGEEGDDFEQYLLSMTTALGFRFGRQGRWASLLDQWLTMWLTADDHPNVQGSSVPPSAARAEFASRIGLPVDRWLGGIWSLAMRWVMALTSGFDHQVTGYADDLFQLPLEGATVQFSDAFIAAFRTHCVTDLTSFREDCRKECPEYAGLGSLPQSDSLATRNSPVLEFSDGWMVPLSIDLLAERSVDIHRLLVGVAAAGRATGPLFEAFVSDLFGELGDRVRIVGEAELAAATPRGNKHADLLVIHGMEYLAVEMSVQTMPRGIAAGDPTSIVQMAERYQREADQAMATVEALHAIAATLGSPEPRVAAFLVVTDTAVAHSPVFLRLLERARPGRPGKFLCTPSDIDHLVRLSQRGWSVTGIIARWQARREQVPLSHYLDELTQITGLREDDGPPGVDRWLLHLPRREEGGAAPAG